MYSCPCNLYWLAQWPYYRHVWSLTALHSSQICCKIVQEASDRSWCHWVMQQINSFLFIEMRDIECLLHMLSHFFTLLNFDLLKYCCRCAPFFPLDNWLGPVLLVPPFLSEICVFPIICSEICILLQNTMGWAWSNMWRSNWFLKWIKPLWTSPNIGRPIHMSVPSYWPSSAQMNALTRWKLAWLPIAYQIMYFTMQAVHTAHPDIAAKTEGWTWVWRAEDAKCGRTLWSTAWKVQAACRILCWYV